MPRPNARSDLNLKWLELFQICARHGSLQATAKETGLSISTVSYHLRSLENHLGVDLFNHAKRPMVLTAKGQVFLRNIDTALVTIRKAQAEASAGEIAEARYLRIGIIEDFDSDVAPELAVDLSHKMPTCDFLYHTATSHEIIDMLRNRQLDIGVTTTPPDRFRDLQDRPLLRDPFVVVLPIDHPAPLNEIFNGDSNLPFLRFSSDLIIAGQIAAQMRRLGLTFPNRFECASNQTLMAMVAAGAGWTITTPLLFSRARRFQAQLKMHPFPSKQFARTLSISSTPDCANTVVDAVENGLRDGLIRHLIDPVHVSTPWLAGQLTLLDR